MIFGQLAVTNRSLLSNSSQTIEKVTSFKLLGVYIDSSLSCSTHMDHVRKKANYQVIFPKATQKSWFV